MRMLSALPHFSICTTKDVVKSKNFMTFQVETMPADDMTLGKRLYAYWEMRGRRVTVIKSYPSNLDICDTPKVPHFQKIGDNTVHFSKIVNKIATMKGDRQEMARA